MLPFFAIAVILVFLWARREFGDLAAVMAAALFTTLPNVLAFSGLAYTDMATGCTQFAAFFAFATWLQKPSWRHSLVLGLAAGLAFLAKLTTLLFLPAAAIAILLSKWWIERRTARVPEGRPEGAQAGGEINRRSQLSMALAVCVVVIWAGYGFSVGHIRQTMGISAEAMPTFQHFPRPARGIVRTVVQNDVLLPAPALLRGIGSAWVLNQEAPPAYLLGNVKQGGWWYFFLIGIAVKAPVPFLLLTLVGLGAIFTVARPVRWTAVAPVASAAAILIVTMFVKYNAGVRHVMVVFPLLAVIAGRGSRLLWQLPGAWRFWGRCGLVILLLWQCISSGTAGPDYIAYFNELAGPDPSRVLVAGCDLDCGQDMFRLTRAMHERHISHFNLAVWSSADMSQMNLPAFDTLPPSRPVAGWVAISLRALRFGDVFHTTYPRDSFSWLDQREPVQRIGKTILLYYVILDSTADAAGVPSSTLNAR